MIVARGQPEFCRLAELCPWGDSREVRGVLLQQTFLSADRLRRLTPGTRSPEPTTRGRLVLLVLLPHPFLVESTTLGREEVQELSSIKLVLNQRSPWHQAQGMASMEWRLPDLINNLRGGMRSKRLRSMEKARASHLLAREVGFKRVTASFTLREKLARMETTPQGRVEMPLRTNMRRRKRFLSRCYLSLLLPLSSEEVEART